MALALLAACGDLGAAQPSAPDPVAPDAGGESAPPSALLCRAELAVGGSFAATLPASDGRCDPAGTWTLTLTVSDPGSCGEVPLAASYLYQVSGGPDTGYQVSYPADPDSDHVFLKVTSEGGTCQGAFEHYAADGKALLVLKPYASGAALAGQASWEEYSAPQI